MKRRDLDESEATVRPMGVREATASFHSLKFWSEALLAVRGNGLPARQHYSGLSLPAVSSSSTDDAALRAQITVLQDNWIITDRYLSRQSLLTITDIHDVFEAFMGILSLYDAGKI